jgi:AcrR family transcriptional regulator
VPRKAREEARRARTDVYRQHILEAAEQVFAERGFEPAKVQEISKLAGLSMGTIYAIFPSKNDIFRAILEERASELLAIVEEVVGREAGPREALHALIEGYIDYFLAHPSLLRMHLRLGSSWALRPGQDADSRGEHWERIQTLQAEIFRRGIAEGAFVDEDPVYLAKTFSVMDQVLLADWVAGGMKADRAVLIRRLQAMVDRAFARPDVARARSAARSA